jgi:4-nitrophenyl phosphatase
MEESFSNVRALIVDMDGVLWHGSEPLPGLKGFFQTVRERQLRFILATNNASLTADQYVRKLAGMGVEVEPAEILTSGMATARYLGERLNPAITRVFAIGEDGLRLPLEERGFTLTDLYAVDAHVVTCGMDRSLSWDKLATATLNIRAGAVFIGTNPDLTLPTEHGQTHGNGAVLAALRAATGVAPVIIGKPEPIMYQQAISLLQSDPAQTVAIGDRLETDILGAARADIRSVMVLSGIATREDLATTDYWPTWVMPGLEAVTQALRA